VALGGRSPEPAFLPHFLPAGFWLDARVLDRLLNEGDSWALSAFAGFPAQKLDWYAMVK